MTPMEPMTPMTMLLLAAAVFLLGHPGISSTPLRPLLVRALGEKLYMGLFSLAALAAMVWLVMAYGAAPKTALWAAGPALHGFPGLVLPFALVALVAGVSGPNPTSAGQAVQAGAAEPALGILRITRHPVQSAIALWAVAHILAKGDDASLVFFGALLALSVLGPPLMERRKRAEQGAEWQRFAAVTSILPFAAILAGRNRLVLREIGWARVLAALALYVALMLAHPWLFGVRPY